MKKEITNIRGKTHKIDCIACSIQSGEVENPGLIAESKYFVAEQDYEVPIPGFVVLVSKRHLYSIDEFSEEEQLDFIKFLCHLRKTMRKTLNIEHIYIIQEEDTTSSHFHIWLFPRYSWMKEKFSSKIESVKPIMQYAIKNMRNTDNLKKVDNTTQKLKQFFSNTKENKKTKK